jgi:nickel-type superoxide dismutase maturation protease
MTSRLPLRTKVAVAAIILEAGAAAAWLAGHASRVLARSWRARVAVEGRSMAPTLQPGDWLLSDPEAYRMRAPRIGELVLVPDPREAERLLVKRVVDRDTLGRLIVEGDDPSVSTDSRTFGALDPATVEGRPWFRYWPLRRMGRLR